MSCSRYLVVLADAELEATNVEIMNNPNLPDSALKGRLSQILQNAHRTYRYCIPMFVE